MENKNYFDQKWLFKGVMIVPGGSAIEIRAARFSYQDGIFEAGEVYDADKQILFRSMEDCCPYELGWNSTNIYGKVVDVIVEPNRTLFTLVAAS